MSTAAVSSSSLSQQLQSYFQARQSDLQQLGKALENGDLSGAQTAYNNIVTLGQSGPSTTGNPFLVNQREQDFTAIGTALQAGDLASAQQAFATLRSTWPRAQSEGGSTPATGPAIIVNLSNSSGGNSTPTPASASTPASTSAPTPASSTGPEIVLNLNNSGSTSPEQITISLSNSASGGEQLLLSVGSQGSNPEQVTFNLGSNSNEQIVVNLLDGSSSSGGSSSSSSSGGLSVSA
jgi:hypothetical protein